MINVKSFILNSVSEATCIANGDKSFYVVGSASGIVIGDVIHFNLISGNNYVKHDVDKMLYIVSYIDRVCDEIAVINIRSYVSWATYVNEFIIEAFNNNSTLSAQFYGYDNIERSKVESYNDFSLFLHDRNGHDIQRDIRDIVKISIT